VRAARAWHLVGMLSLRDTHVRAARVCTRISPHFVVVDWAGGTTHFIGLDFDGRIALHVQTAAPTTLSACRRRRLYALWRNTHVRRARSK
jgi:hypothetical protein